MGQYNITKIIDGLFISDQIVALDLPFLVSNKIIRVLGWTVQPLRHQIREDELQELIIPKDTSAVKFPAFEELEDAFRFLSVFEEEMLCGLIYSQSHLQASLMCIMYLMRRFRWDCNTAHDFLRTKMDFFECSEETINQLEIYQRCLAKHNSCNLNHVLWEYEFLMKYHPSSDDETLIITTIKNKMRKNEQDIGSAKIKAKKTKRIKWQDQLRPSSALSLNSVKRSSILKAKLTSPTKVFGFVPPSPQPQPAHKDLELLYKSVGFKNSAIKQKSSQKDIDNLWQQCEQYQQLKEISRTNFNDRFVSSKVRRRGSLKPKNMDQKQKHCLSTTNVQSLVGIYGGKATKGLSRASSAQSFLTGLRSFNKSTVKMSNL